MIDWRPRYLLFAGVVAIVLGIDLSLAGLGWSSWPTFGYRAGVTLVFTLLVLLVARSVASATPEARRRIQGRWIGIGLLICVAAIVLKNLFQPETGSEVLVLFCASNVMLNSEIPLTLKRRG